MKFDLHLHFFHDSHSVWIYSKDIYTSYTPCYWTAGLGIL
jgi:hypothetical protein